MQFPEFPTQRPVAHWIPFAFCCFLSLLALVDTVRDGSAGPWSIAFFAFLPMCFFYMASVTTGMQREINSLRGRLQALPAPQEAIVEL